MVKQDSQLPVPLPPTLPISMFDHKHALRLHNFIFIGTKGKIRALEILEGGKRTVWTEELKGCGYHMVHLYLFIGTGNLYVATNGHILCLDALTGNTIWRTTPEAQHGFFASDLMTLLCTQDGSILFSASNGALVALNAYSGQIIWQCYMEDSGGTKNSYALLEQKGLLYVGNEGDVYCFYICNGQLKWKNGLEGVFSPMTLITYSFVQKGIISDILLVGTQGYVLALDGPTGNTLHHMNLNGTGYKPVAMLLDPQTDTLYTATSGELRCFKADSLEQIWKTNLPGMGYSFGHSLLLLDSETLIIGINGKVAAVNRKTSQIEWKKNLPGFGTPFVTVAATPLPDMFICGASGKIYAIDKEGKQLWKDSLESMGSSKVCVSTTVFNTDFNSTTLPQCTEMGRRTRKI